MRAKIEVISYSKEEIDRRFNGHLVMLTVSGSHAYGWTSPDSDIDYRGVYLAGTENFLKVQRPPRFNIRQLVPYDLELKELGDYTRLGLDGNCNVLDQINSDWIYRTPTAVELREVINNHLTKDGIYRSYMGLANSNYEKFILKGKGLSYKKYLYILRALMCAIHLFQTGVVEPNMVKLNEYFKFPEVKVLLKHKIEGTEEEAVDDLTFGGKLDSMIPDLQDRLDKAYVRTKIPAEREPEELEEVDKWLMRKRLDKIGK